MEDAGAGAGAPRSVAARAALTMATEMPPALVVRLRTGGCTRASATPAGSAASVTE